MTMTRLPVRLSACVLLTALLAVSGCNELPQDGPLLSEVRDEADRGPALRYHLVKLEPDLLPVLADADRDPPESFVSDLGVSGVRVGPGDVLTITIIEPGAGGLFTPPPGNGVVTTDQGAKVVTLPPARVNENGRVTVPFAGDVAVAGHTSQEISHIIENALAGQAVRPQVMVDLDTKANRFTVAGTVKTPGLFQMDEHGQTLLEAIAAAGGPTDSPQDTVVQLNRFGQAHAIRMQSLLDRPETNVHVRAGDYIHLYLQPRRYTILGAALHPTEAPLPYNRLTLAEALGLAGGIDDMRADTHGLLLLRFERRATLDRIVAVEAKIARRRGQDLPGTLDAETERLPPDTPLPVIYELNTHSGTGLFLAREVTMRERDMVFLADAEGVQWKKLLNLIRVDVGFGNRVY